MNAAYELFDHTADLGVRVRAATWPELARTAIDALYATIGRVALGAAGQPRTFEYAEAAPEVMLRDLLAELLTLFEIESKAVDAVEIVAFDERRLVVTAEVVDVELELSDFAREVKAVTYHELALRSLAGGGYEFICIVDI